MVRNRMDSLCKFLRKLLKEVVWGGGGILNINQILLPLMLLPTELLLQFVMVGKLDENIEPAI